MDIVLRTPNGEAEVSVGPGQEDVILGDLVERVTGRAPGQIVYVDGRAVPSTTTIGTSGLLTGSTISTTDDVVVPPADARVELVQVAGEGAGARTWLSTGRYTIGIGRRVSAPELTHAPVDRPMLELDVDSDGAVSVRSAAVRARLDGVELSADAATSWTSGLVDVGGRVFVLGGRDPRAAMHVGHRFGGVGIDGTAAFNRPPRLAAPPPPPPIDVPDGGANVGGARRFRLLAGAERSGRRGDVDGSSRADRAAIAEFTELVARRHAEEVANRRRAHPDLAAVAELADVVSPGLWQRRPGHHDVFRFPIGLADLDWTPELARGPRALATAQAIVAASGPLPMVPVTVDLLDERGLGVVGGTEFSRSLVRGLLLEAAVTHGPADLDVVVLTSPDRAYAWEWVKWLPHARSGGATRIYSSADQVAGWAGAARRAWERPSRPTAPTHLTLVVVDEPAWWRERSAPLRPLFSDASMPLRFVTMTADAADVPAVCTTVVTASPDHGAVVEHLLDRRRVEGLHAYLASDRLALVTARRLAPLDDPDGPMAATSSLPESVGILPLLDLEVPTAQVIADRWSARDDHRVRAPIGVTERGPLRVDLVDDGPHALVAGTTGAGKSELLCTLVVGLAAELPPNDVNFVLVDVKGGSAFDACADLPHTVGMVTDLDEHLAGRVLRCLRAELQHREQVLRGAGVSSLVEYQQVAAVSPLPRLVLVVDEFASVAAELPEFLPSLVETAQRGRSLGLHMVLATQRPAGVVDDKIRANTNLRIALRVQDDGDSIDVIGTKDAAQLPRRLPGRGYARLGAGELTMFQSAFATGGSSAEADGAAVPAEQLDAVPYVVGRELSPMESRLLRLRADERGRPATGRSDLVRLVDAIAGAAHRLGQTEQRQPCPDPLPERIEASEFFVRHPGDAIPFALLDLPDEQRQAPAWWSPGPEGSLIAYGIAGAGTSSLLVSLIVGIAQRCDADDVHVYCIDADNNLLAPLDALPHVGGVVRVDEPDRVARLVNHLAGVLDHRTQLALERGGPAAVAAAEPTVVFVIDNVGSLRQMLDERRDIDGVWAELERVIRDGRALGICAVLTAKQEGAVPSSLAAQIPARLVMRLGDQFGYAGFGLRPAEIPTFVAGRAVRPDDKIELQLVLPPTDLTDVVAGIEPAVERPVRRIDPLPARVTVDEVMAAARASARSLVVPVGLDSGTGEPATAEVPFGETVFVTGAPGTGRSSILVAFAEACRRTAPDVDVFAVAPRGGPLGDVAGVDRPVEPADVAAWVQRIASAAGRRLVLVDDADRLGGPSFDALAALRDDRLIVVVAGRGDDLRVAGHWSKPLQRFRHGVLLRPGPADGDLVRVSLGPRLGHFPPHRGILVVDGEQRPIVAAVVGASSEGAGSEGASSESQGTG